MNSPSRRLYLLAPPLLAAVAVLGLLFGLGGTAHVAEANGLANRCFATPDGGTTVYASSTFTPVQAAVDNLGATGGTVLVAGSCAGVQVRDGLTQTVYISAPITLRGGYTSTDWISSDPLAHPTVLDAERGGRVISTSHALTIENLTIQNGSSTSQGGGVYSGGPTTISNSRIVNNETTSAGGGLFISSTLAITGTQFLSNTSGAFAGGGVLAKGAVTVVNSLFMNNECKGNAGGGLYADTTLAMTGTQILSNTARSHGGGAVANEAATIVDSLFVNNESTNGGGGAFIAASTLTMTGVSFLSNTSNDRGGAVWVIGATNIMDSHFEHNESTSTNRGGGGLNAASTLAMTGTSFLSNTAKFQGGAMVADGAATVANSRFQNNRSTTNLGGGIYAKDVLSLTNSLLVSNTARHGGAIFAKEALSLTNSTLAANHAISSSGAISTTGLLTIGNSILWANTPDQAAASGAFSVARSIIEDGELGGINGDPLFVRNPDRSAGDLGNLHLRQNSPAIDAGDDSLVPAAITTDLDGLNRKFDVLGIANNGANIVDMGAYELNSQIILPTADAGGPYTGDEGSPIDLDGSGSASAHGLVGYGWDCNDDGAFDALASQPTGDSCTYANNGSFTLRLVVTDTGGLTDTNTATVTVNNVAPIVTPPSNQTATAGTQKAFSLGSFSDPGADSLWTVTVEWGDSSDDTVFDAASPGDLPSQPHTYTANGTYTVTLKVDDGEESGSATFQVQVGESGGENNPPFFTSNPPLAATVGVAYNYNVTSDDSDSADTLTLSAPTKPGWLTLTGTGNGATTLAGTPNNDDLGANAVVLVVQDQDGASATQSFTIIVSAAPATTGSVSGKVVDPSDAPIGNAQVTISNEGGALHAALVRTESADANGAYRFDGVPAGAYSLTVSANGYLPSDVVAVSVGEGETVSVDPVILQKGSSSLYLPVVTKRP